MNKCFNYVKGFLPNLNFVKKKQTFEIHFKHAFNKIKESKLLYFP
jgi:hypothetical protein